MANGFGNFAKIHNGANFFSILKIIALLGRFDDGLWAHDDCNHQSNKNHATLMNFPDAKFRYYIRHYICIKCQLGNRKRALRNKRLGDLESLGPKEWQSVQSDKLFRLLLFCATLPIMWRTYNWEGRGYHLPCIPTRSDYRTEELISWLKV